MRENLCRRAVTKTTRHSLAAIALSKNRRRVSNTCDLRCRLYFARLDARIVLARDHLHEVDFNVSRVPGLSRARVNSKSYAIYESPRHRRSQGGAQGARAPPIKIPPMIETTTTYRLALFSCSFFSAITHITIINNNINDNEVAPGPLTNNQGAKTNDYGAQTNK